MVYYKKHQMYHGSSFWSFTVLQYHVPSLQKKYGSGTMVLKFMYHGICIPNVQKTLQHHGI